jgi:excisionase family DNA binding protein
MLTVPEAAQLTGRSPETIRRWIRSGRLPSSKVGTQHLIDENDLSRMVEQRAGDVREASTDYAWEALFLEDPVPSRLRKRISVNPRILAGKPAIKGTRISVELVLEFLAAGWSIEEFLDNYPTVTLEDIRACFAFARDAVASEHIYPLPPT